jgi:hypothetical protein
MSLKKYEDKQNVHSHFHFKVQLPISGVWFIFQVYYLFTPLSWFSLQLLCSCAEWVMPYLKPNSFPATTHFRTKHTLTIILFILLNLFTVANAVEIFDYSQCSPAANATYYAAPNDTFLRDQNGNPTSNFSEAWGISYDSCRVLCTGGAKFIDWNDFSLQFGSWLLPWLALTAQLPFETKAKSTNLQSLLLAIGSPILIIYSLALTILNARSINREFRQLKEENEELERPRQAKVIGAARVILIESQSIPLQTVNGADRELAQLVVNPENWTWWIAVKNEILKTKREWTYSLIAQLIMVVTAQVLSIIDFFTSQQTKLPSALVLESTVCGYG